jgi:uncharacterized membrane protein
MGPVRVGTRSAGVRLGPLSMNSSYRRGRRGRRSAASTVDLIGTVVLLAQAMWLLMRLTWWTLKWTTIVYTVCAVAVILGVGYCVPRTRPLAQHQVRAIQIRRAQGLPSRLWLLGSR